MSLRSPICTICGHVDHGKTSILDRIRNTSIAVAEAGGITQAIGASKVPLQTIKKVCGPLLEALKLKFTIPGLLFIDTPGHAAFTNLRKRGGNLADIAILVVDMNEGFKPQTEEALEILRTYKTPFIVACNKIDLVKGWQSKKTPLLQTLGSQAESTIQDFETKLYKIVSKIHELAQKDAERFDRVSDYTKQIALVPVSAKTGEGISELLMVITGLAQRYLGDKLAYSSEVPAKGTVLEVKESKGIGTSLDVIIYDGILKVNDSIVIGGLNTPIVTKVRSLFEPVSLAEMRDKKSKFKTVKSVTAATGVKIAAPDLKEVVAGMPIRSCKKEDIEKVSKEIQKEVETVIIETDKEGVVIKADSLGSLEALINMLKEKNIPIKKASIGNISKKDIADAEANLEKNPFYAVVLGFGVTHQPTTTRVKLIVHDVIYQILDEYEKWVEKEKKKLESSELDSLVKPCKLEILKGYVFRQKSPAVVGVHVMKGTLKVTTPLMKENGKEITEVKSIQMEQKSIDKAEKDKQVAISLPGVTVGRQIKEGEILYSSIPENHFRKFKEFKDNISPEEKELLKEIARIKRKQNPVWGI